MIASIDVTELLAETEHLARLIVESEEAKRYRWCKQQLANDEEAQRLIKRFNEYKERYEEVERFGKYHPDYQRIKQEMRAAKRELDLRDTVSQFKRAERELEDILNEVSRIVAYAVSDQIKVPTGHPFWDTMGCGGGGCATGGCGSCGIRK